MGQAIEKQQSGETRQRSRATVGSRHKLKTTCSHSRKLAGGCPSTTNKPRMGTGSGHTTRRKRRQNVRRPNEPKSGAQGPTGDSSSGTSTKGPPKARDVDAGEVAPGSNRDSRKTHMTLGISLGRTTVRVERAAHGASYRRTKTRRETHTVKGTCRLKAQAENNAQPEPVPPTGRWVSQHRKPTAYGYRLRPQREADTGNRESPPGARRRSSR